MTHTPAPAAMPYDPWLELDTLVRNAEEYPRLLPQITSLIDRLQRSAASWESRHEEMRELYERAFAERESLTAALLAARREERALRDALTRIAEPPAPKHPNYISAEAERLREIARAALAATPGDTATQEGT